VTFQELTGEAYWYLPSASVDGDKVPQQIWVIPSQFINPKFGKSLNDAITHYEYKRGNVEVNLPVEDIIMFTYPNPNNTFTGFSIIRGITAAVYIQREMNAFETSILENRARMGGIIEESKNISRPESERVKQRIKQEHAGPRNAGKDLYLPGGLKYTRSAMTPEELSFIEGRKQNRIEIMAAHDIPEAILISESANRANSEGAAYQWAKYGILPRLKRIEEKLNERLLPRYDDNLFVSFDDPVPEDREQVLKESIGLTGAGIKGINEDRMERGLEPVEGGEEPLIDSKRIPLSMAGVMPEATLEEEERFVGMVSSKAMDKVKEILG
jgi:HK97 family phage portal protein